jgi:TP901 family phage tail tape measure protein
VAITANVGTARLRAILDASGLRTGIAESEGALRGFSGKANAELQKLGRSFTRTGRTLSLALTAPLVGAGIAIVKVAGDFERSTNRVRALTGATGEAFERLRKQAIDLGSSTQFSAVQAAEAQAFLAQAGFETDQIFRALPSTLDLAGAAQLDLGRSADIVSNILTGLQLPVEELPHAVDVLAKAFISANTDLEMLGQGFKFVGPVASGFGVSLEETAAALGQLSNAGIQASSAGTGLRRIITTLAREQDKLGISTTDATGKLRPLADILEDIEARGLDAAEIMRIFGDRGGPALVALLGQGSGALRELTAELETAAGTAERIQEVQLTGLQAEITQLKSAAEGLAIAFGDSGLLGAATGIVSKLTDMVRGFTNLEPPVQRAILVVGGLTAAIGPLLIVIGRLIQAIPLITAALGALRTAGLLMAGPAGWLALAVLAAGGLAIKLAGSDRDSLEPAINRVRDAIGTGDARTLTGALEGLRRRVGTDVQPAIDGLIAKIRETGEVTAEVAAQIEELLTGVPRRVLETQRSAVQAQIRTLEAQRLPGGATRIDTTALEAQIDALREEGNRLLDVDPFDESGRANEIALEIQKLEGTIASGADLTARETARIAEVNAGIDQEIARLSSVLGGLDESIAALDRSVEAAAPPPPGAAPPPAAGGGLGTGGAADPIRTVRAVFDELGAAGAESASRAARLLRAGAGLEAAEDDIATRLSLVRSALDELLTDFWDDVTDDQIAYLVRRESELEADLAELRTKRAQVEPDTGIADALESGAASDAVVARILRAERFWYSTLDRDVADRLRAQQGSFGIAGSLFPTPEEIAAAPIEPDPRTSDAIVARILFAERLRDPVIAARLRAQQGGAADASAGERDAFRADLEAIDARAAQIRAWEEASERLTIRLEQQRARLDPANIERLSAQQAGTATESEAYRAELEAIQARIDQIRAWEEASERLTLRLQQQQARLDPANIARLAAQQGGAPGAPSPFSTGRLLPPSRELPAGEQRDALETGAKIRLELAQGAADAALRTREAADGFRNAVIMAGAQFTAGFIEALASGDVVGALTSAFGAASSGLSALSTFGGDAFGFSSGLTSTLGLIGGLLPIAGGLITGLISLFSGRNRTTDAERERIEAERRQRATPAINLTAIVNQTNNFNAGVTDPRVRSEVTQLTREIVGEVFRQAGYEQVRRAALGGT